MLSAAMVTTTTLFHSRRRTMLECTMKWRRFIIGYHYGVLRKYTEAKVKSYLAAEAVPVDVCQPRVLSGVVGTTTLTDMGLTIIFIGKFPAAGPSHAMWWAFPVGKFPTGNTLEGSKSTNVVREAVLRIRGHACWWSGAGGGG